MSLICLTQLCLDYLADVCNLIHYCAPNKVLQRKKNVQTLKTQSRAISLKLMQEHDGRSIFGSRDITLIAGFHAKAPLLIIIFCSLIKIISNLITTTLHHNCNLSMHACQYDVAPPHITTTFQILHIIY